MSTPVQQTYTHDTLIVSAQDPFALINWIQTRLLDHPNFIIDTLFTEYETETYEAKVNYFKDPVPARAVADWLLYNPKEREADQGTWIIYVSIEKPAPSPVDVDECYDLETKERCTFATDTNKFTKLY